MSSYLAGWLTGYAALVAAAALVALGQWAWPALRRCSQRRRMRQARRLAAGLRLRRMA